ncbi:chemotaxis-specific protein-glutamate methyltransferase CheB [Reichenbachiella ulvae]|uniref:Protein-glutamate methylesterase/protein-glutamine glutaminase n=1 Tax=Reichenbachiella ulvae TaxID=2980104 RepID=A0ABT3CNL9_9BACT|nr:chemotaxis-specific protein-glutamate methyltransferase CheB [Reichenbachiella ulvae]MCV9385202.1 chemotaxis-specific protein-glutamate methyltransferase CheB [Reichenbachiella ulvae]
MSHETIDVLIADDSGFMQLLIKSILSVDQNIKVIATANNGKEAYELTRTHRPKVVVMDMMMPKYDGLYGVEQIMKNCPTSILMLSAIGHTDINPIMNSLKLGAIDYLNKPQGSLSKLRSIDSEIVKKVKLAASINVNEMDVATRSQPKNESAVESSQVEAIIIGASTGGPRALESVLKALPEKLKVPVVVAQHMPSNFITSFTDRLNNILPQRVRVADIGMFLEPGIIYIAPGDKNIALERKGKSKVKVALDEKVYPEYNHPSVNSVMMSAAKVYGNKTLGVILTGMGEDGARGMTDIYRVGGITIAQDRESSVVFGMPQKAIQSGCIKKIMPLDAIGNNIKNHLL